MNSQPNNPLHGIKLADILEYLVETYGWNELGERIKIRCFQNEPSIKSSLRFLRKTLWAREKVERLYLQSIKSKPHLPSQPKPPSKAWGMPFIGPQRAFCKKGWRSPRATRRCCTCVIMTRYFFWHALTSFGVWLTRFQVLIKPLLARKNRLRSRPYPRSHQACSES